MDFLSEILFAWAAGISSFFKKGLMNLDMSNELTISHNDSRNLRVLTTEHMEPMTPLSLTWHDLGNK
jgi:hypothetical protein